MIFSSEFKLLPNQIFFDDLSNFTCPSCFRGKLFFKKKNFKFKDNHRARFHGNFSDEDDKNAPQKPKYAIGNATCSSCANFTNVIGVARYETLEIPNDHGGHDISNFVYLTPLYFAPTVDLFELTGLNAPTDVLIEIQKSFEVVWISPTLAALCLRKALERMLDLLNVPKFRRDKRLFRLSLNKRIDIFVERRNKKFDSVEIKAVKAIGNAGGHESDTVTLEDLLSAYELFVSVLKKIFPDKNNELKKVAHQLSKKYDRVLRK